MQLKCLRFRVFEERFNQLLVPESRRDIDRCGGGGGEGGGGEGGGGEGGGGGGDGDVHVVDGDDGDVDVIDDGYDDDDDDMTMINVLFVLVS